MAEKTEYNESILRAKDAFCNFMSVIQTLRSPNGCPWDKEQTPLSMRRDLIEETFEAVDAISAQDFLHAKEELGDVFLNTMMISYMYEQAGKFTVSDVIAELAEKLVRRHPHVFTQSEGKSQVTKPVSNSEEVLNQWDRIKQNVEGRKGNSILDEVPQGFPPLLRAYKLQKKAAKKGFDWQELSPVLGKVQEELSELNEAWNEYCAAMPKDAAQPFTMRASDEQNTAFLHVEEEAGDLLFAVVNYVRKLGLDPETVLSRANKKFYDRFTYVEQKMQEQGLPMDADHFAEQDALWEEAKQRLSK